MHGDLGSCWAQKGWGEVLRLWDLPHMPGSRRSWSPASLELSIEGRGALWFTLPLASARTLNKI